MFKNHSSGSFPGKIPKLFFFLTQVELPSYHSTGYIKTGNSSS